MASIRSFTDPRRKANRGTVFVRGTESKNSRRTLALTNKAYEVLKECERISDVSLCSRRTNAKQGASGSAMSHAQELVRAKLKAPSDFTAHSLRHTFATRLGEDGADAFTIMRVLGHASVTTSQRYVHPTVGQVVDTFVTLEQLTAQALA